MLAVPHTAPLDARQSSILRNRQSAARAEELAALIDVLENRLGKGRVYRLALQESYIPERAVKRQAAIPETPKASSGAAPRHPGKRLCLSGVLSNKIPDNASGISGMTVNGSSSPGMTEAWQRLGARPIRLFARPQPIEVTAALPDAPPVLFRWRKILHRIVSAEGPERIAPEWWRGGAAEAVQIRDYYRVESTQGLRFWVFREGTYGGGQLPRWFLHGLFP
jgi:protein ImuB